MASVNCQRISGRSGEPKFRQSVTPSGRPPAQETLRAASQTAMAAPRRGWRNTCRPLPSVEIARARRVPFTLSTAASEPGSTRVLIPTCWSYWRNAHPPLLLAATGHHQQHALLRLRKEDLVGGHLDLAPGYARQLHLHAGASPRRHLGGTAGQPGRTHVLDSHHGAGLHELQTCLEEQLLREGIAHLHRRPALLGALVERRRGHRGAVDAVSPRLVADVEHRIPDSLGAGAEDPVGPDEPHAHHVDERVARVLGREGDLAADGGAAEAVAVPADAGHDALDQPACLRVVRLAEAERIEEGDGAGAHREDVPQDSAHPGGGALEGLDERGVIVALDLEDDGPAVADVDDAGILAGPLQHVRARLG